MSLGRDRALSQAFRYGLHRRALGQVGAGTAAHGASTDAFLCFVEQFDHASRPALLRSYRSGLRNDGLLEDRRSRRRYHI